MVRLRVSVSVRVRATVRIRVRVSVWVGARVRATRLGDVAVPDEPERLAAQHAHLELVPHLVLAVAHAARHLLREVQRGSDRVLGERCREGAAPIRERHVGRLELAHELAHRVHASVEAVHLVRVRVRIRFRVRVRFRLSFRLS